MITGSWPWRSTGRGVGAYVSTTGNVVGSTVWSDGVWSAPAPIAATAVARSRPAIDATGGTTSHLVYQDAAYKYWHLALTGTWSAPQAMQNASDQFFGPVAVSVAARGADATAVFVDGESNPVNDVAQADLTGGTWQARSDLTGPESFTASPVVVPLSAGPELMVAFVQQSGQISFATRTSGVWSAPASIANCLTGDPPALAPLPGGGAILALRGQDANLYWTVYSGGSWSPVAAFASPDVSITSAPAVTHGIAGDTAEIAFVEGDGHAYHARLSGSAWSAPVMVGGANLDGVAIAASP